MIEWKKYDKDNPPPTKTYLVFSRDRIAEAEPHIYTLGKENAWCTSEGYLLFNVSHYAEINLPEDTP